MTQKNDPEAKPVNEITNYKDFNDKTDSIPCQLNDARPLVNSLGEQEASMNCLSDKIDDGEFLYQVNNNETDATKSLDNADIFKLNTEINEHMNKFTDQANQETNSLVMNNKKKIENESNNDDHISVKNEFTQILNNSNKLESTNSNMWDDPLITVSSTSLLESHNSDVQNTPVFVMQSQSFEEQNKNLITTKPDVTAKLDLLEIDSSKYNNSFINDKMVANDLESFTASLKKKSSLSSIDDDIIVVRQKKDSFINVEAMQFESEFLTRRIKEGRDNEEYVKAQLKEKSTKLDHTERKIRDLKLRLIRFAKDDEAKDKRVAALEREIERLNLKIEEMGNIQNIPAIDTQINYQATSKVEPLKKSFVCVIL